MCINIYMHIFCEYTYMYIYTCVYIYACVYIYKSQGKELCLPLHLGVVAFEKGAFGSSSTKVAIFKYIYIYIYFLLAHWPSG